MTTKKRILLALSGGPDSAVAGALLRSQGFDLVGIHVAKGELGQKICAGGVRRDPARVAKVLEIPLIHVDAAGLYEAEVIDPLVHAAMQCYRPASCTCCHQKVLIPALFKKVEELGLDGLATGHYVKLHYDQLAQEVRLGRASDLERDQSYLFAGVDLAHLSRMLAPLGDLTRHLTFRLLQESGLEDLARSKCPLEGAGAPAFSQGLVENRVAKSLFRPGIIRTKPGRVLSDHGGQYRYRVGQKIDLGSLTQGEEYFVLGVVPSQDAVVIGPRSELARSAFIANGAWWLRANDELRGLECEIWFDPGVPLAPARVVFHSNQTLTVELTMPVVGLEPGQVVVFYREGEVLGTARVDPLQSAKWALASSTSI